MTREEERMNNTLRVLLVEDDPGDVEYIQELLKGADAVSVDLQVTDHLTSALSLLGEDAVDLVLLDLGLPDSQGLDTFQRLHTQCPRSAIVVLTGYDDEETALKAIKMGAQDYLVKGRINGPLLTRSMRYAVERNRVEEELRQARDQLELRVQERTQELENTLQTLSRTLQGTIRAMSAVVECRDPYTAGHQRRVANLARTVARAMGIDGERVKAIYMAGLIHDLGKISVPCEILSKPGSLTKYEVVMLHSHPLVGYNILKKIEYSGPVAHVVLQHHERMNGSGYPDGISGNDILMEARIVGVADVVEAMASHRPYRPALGIRKALEEIKQKRGTFYDPDAVDACLELFRKNRFVFETTAAQK